MAFGLSTTAGVGVGTISIARNGTTVTGVGTNFTSPSLVNQIILVNGFNSRVTAVASATSMTIVSAPTYDITGETFRFVTASTNINQTGADTDPSGLSELLGVRTSRVGIQAVYDLGCLRLATTGAAATFSYDANLHCIVWSNQVVQPELTNGAGRIITATGARTDGTYTAPFYPRALAMPRVLPSGDSSFLPARRAIVNNGTLNFSGVWIDANQVQEIGGTANFTDVKWSATNQAANFRMNSGNINVNGMDLHNMPLTLISQAGSLNGLRFFNSGYTPVSLPARAPTNPRIYTDWNFQGKEPLMNNFSGNANYVEFVNFGDWAGFRLATNSAVNMAARFTKAVSVNVIDTLGAGITDAIVYRLDTNNGSRTHYATDEHFIETTASGLANGKILALVGRMPAGAANNSTQYTAFMDCRNAANDQTGNDILRYVSYEYLLNNRAINTKGTLTLTVEQTLFDDPNITLDKAGAIAKLASSFTVDPVTKIVTVTANSSFDDVYDALKAYKATANALNLATPTLDTLIVTPNGTSLEAFTGWSLVVNTGVTLSSGVKFDKVEFDTITLTGTAQITGIYQDSTGTSTVLEISGFDAGSAVYVEDNSEIEKFFSASTSGTVTVYIPPTGTGSWYYAVEKYGIQRQSDFFTFSGGLKEIVVKAIPDIGLTESNIATVAAYTTLENPDKIYDYVAYLRTTTPHISYGQILFKDGTSLYLADASMLVDQSFGSVASFNYDTKLLTIKSLVLGTGISYTKIVADPPASITANTNEIITILIEDANGDSRLSILGGDNEGYELWKVTTATATDDYETGELLITLPDNVEGFRFIGISGFDIVGRDISSGVRRRSSMLKGNYTQSFYVGDQIQLSTNAPQLVENNQKLDELILKVDNNLDVAVSTRLAAINYVEPDNDGIADANTKLDDIQTKVDTLENTDLTGIALEATSQEILTTVQDIDVDFTPVLDAIDLTLKTSQYTAPDNVKIGQIKTKVDTLENTNTSTLATTVQLEEAKDEILANSSGATPEEIADQVWLDQPDRLKNVSTVQITGEQLKTYIDN
jgi:hypothetical protein